ncbi:DUF2304 domain-containing protein [Thiorhodococcus minor]|uniref:DUF2304 domain-containing protein n=1 Tax=Thiorhodococcus minor TaxID=57489 RepID=A0A6M0K0J9_9GAMM|nr:DUF2304 domain-containing protein [Thiorhodococcus minor]NEV62824.1 DUF2304 domain-containing protein [Thiorhodococcus minor]
MTYQMTSTAIGLMIGVVILFLVRRDHLHGPYALWWVAAACMAVLLGLFPRIIDYVAVRMGVSYPPMLAMVLGLGLLLLKILTMDLERSRQERQIRRLAQQIAIMQARQESRARSSEHRLHQTPADQDQGEA